jgi:fructosamine-3-kinase
LSDGNTVFVKVRHGVPADFFAAEARGLRALAAAASRLRVPQVFAVGEHGIALDDLGHGQPRLQQWQHAGRALARLHAQRATRFGFEADGYCGDTPQDNRWLDDGHAFFAERRLLPQARRARDAGRLAPDPVQRIERLCANLAEHVPARPPVLLHGDLWLGNLHACADGELALIDGGAVHYGWAAADLSMLTLFGDPPPAFFAAYEAENGAETHWRASARVLNLYHLLNHLNLFGAQYAAAVRHALNAL